ncbi:MAG TPA: 2OG-Fe(II) oxygenase, partial [Burkholderiales bacterium]|nr:2OG-Fe(II) oxygenase [Burkholderiales bacterium]
MTTREELVTYIHAALTAKRDQARVKFLRSKDEVGVRYCYVDDLLPASVAARIHAVFPKSENMRLMSSFREVKYTTKNFDDFDPLLKDVTFAIQDPRIVNVVETITGIAGQIPDPTLYAGGLSLMSKKHFLNPHIDNSHDGSRRYYRTLNLLYYVTPGWELANGGNLELWNTTVRRNVTIVSQYNRLVLMETNPWSWHSVSPVRVEGERCCVSNYYFSPMSPIGYGYFNVTSFSARPEQKLRRAAAWVDNRL